MEAGEEKIDENKNQGKLKLDATCVPADILAYPRKASKNEGFVRFFIEKIG